MLRIHSVLWSILAAGWIIPVVRVCDYVGGCKWIAHMGQSRAVFAAATMVALCLLAAIAIGFFRGLPLIIKLAVVFASSLHLVQTVAFMLFAAGVEFALIISSLLSLVFPSVIVTGKPLAFIALNVALPLICLALALFAPRNLPVEPYAAT